MGGVILCFLSVFIYGYELWLMIPSFYFGLILRETNVLKILSRKSLFYVSLTSFFIYIIMLSCVSTDTYSVPPGPFSAIKNLDVYSLGVFLYMRYFRILIGIVASIFLISVFRLVFHQGEPVSSIIKVLASLGQYTLSIYLIQCILIETVLVNFISFDAFNVQEFSFLISPIYALGLFVVCYIILFYMRRWRVTKFIMGEKS